MTLGNTLTPEQQRQVAALKFDPGFVLLVDYLQSIVDDLADGMYAATAPDDFLRLGRTWQMARSFVAAMREKPEQLAQVIEQETTKDGFEFSNPGVMGIQDRMKQYFRQLQEMNKIAGS